MQAQAKAMNSTWSTARGGGAVCVRFQCTNKCPTKGEELNDLVTNSVKEIRKTDKRLKSKDKNNFVLEEEQEIFNFEDLNIGEERYNASRKRRNKAKYQKKEQNQNKNYIR